MAKSEKVAVWAVRQPTTKMQRRYGCPSLYWVKARRKPRRRANGEWSETGAYRVLAKGFEELFPDCKLKPGGGPVRVR